MFFPPHVFTCVCVFLLQTDMTEVRHLEGHQEGVLCCAFAPPSSSGRTLIATVSRDGSLRVWDAWTAECLWMMDQAHGRNLIHCCAFADIVGPAGDLRLATAAKSVQSEQRPAVKIWNISRNPESDQKDDVSGTMTHSFLPGVNVHSCAFSPVDRNLLATVSTVCTLWRVNEDGTVVNERDIVKIQRPYSCAFSRDGRWLAAGSHITNLVSVANVASGEIMHELTGHTAAVYCCSFDPSGSWLSTGSHDHTIRLWPLTEAGVSPVNLVGHLGPVRGCVFYYRDGRLFLASGSDDMTIKLWDVEARSCVDTLTGHTEGLYSCAVLSAESLLATSAEDRTVKVWAIGDTSPTLVYVLNRIKKLKKDPCGFH